MENMEHFDPDVSEKEKVTGEGTERWIWQGKGDPIKIELSKFRGRNYLNVRKWYLPKDAGLDPKVLENYKPTKQGVSLDIIVSRKVINAMTEILNLAIHED